MGCAQFPHDAGCSCERCNQPIHLDAGPFGIAWCSKPPNHDGQHTALYRGSLILWTAASEQPRAAAPALSDEAREARKPPPPESLVGALQDVVHAESGHLRAAKSVRTPNAAPEQLSEKEKGA